jgi:hypothetical protein
MKRLLICLTACLLLVSCGDDYNEEEEYSRSSYSDEYEEDDDDRSYHSDDYSLNWISTPDSTCFSRISYDSWHDVLAVEFRDSGAQYVYFDVEGWVWDELRDASSMGGYYNSDIKGNYDCERIQ